MFLFFIIAILVAFFLIMAIESSQNKNIDEAKQKANIYTKPINDEVQTKNKSEKTQETVSKNYKKETRSNNDAGDYSWVDEIKKGDVAFESRTSKNNDIDNYSWIDELNKDKNISQKVGVSRKTKKNTEDMSGFKEQKPIREIPSSESYCIINNGEKSRITEKPSQVPEKKRILPIEEKPYTIYVGVDFGTSFTKVAYRISGGMEKVLPLSISTMPSMHYAQPSLIAFKNKEILFGEEAYKFLEKSKLDHGIRCVKMLFAGEIDPDYKNKELHANFSQYCEEHSIDAKYIKPGYWVTAYLVWIINKITTTLQNKFNRELNLNFNVCIPLDTYEKDEVRKGFQKAINVVGEIGQIWNSKNDMSLVEMIAKSWDHAGTEEMEESRIHIIPEAVAQMACYLNSLSVENKIHGVIDFGSGTTDFSIFNLSKDSDGERCAYWLNAVTYPEGMYDVEKIVARHTDKTLNYRNIKYALEHTYTQPQTTRNEIKEFLHKLWEKSRFEVWGPAYGKEVGQCKWQKDKVKIFVCGGGSGLEDVAEIFKESWYQNNYQNWGPYSIERLTVPDDLVLEGINYYDFPRLAVAYGLTTPRPKLHKYVLPKDHIVKKNNADAKNYDGAYWGAVYIDTH